MRRISAPATTLAKCTTIGNVLQPFARPKFWTYAPQYPQRVPGHRDSNGTGTGATSKGDNPNKGAAKNTGTDTSGGDINRRE